MSDDDLIRREDALRAVHDALVVNPRRDEARKLAGFVVSALPAVQPDARIEALTAERDRLREALDAISVAKPGDDPALVLGQVVKIALFALKGDQP